jgi:hypothetical protein
MGRTGNRPFTGIPSAHLAKIHPLLVFLALCGPSVAVDQQVLQQYDDLITVGRPKNITFRNFRDVITSLTTNVTSEEMQTFLTGTGRNAKDVATLTHLHQIMRAQPDDVASWCDALIHFSEDPDANVLLKRNPDSGG